MESVRRRKEDQWANLPLELLRLIVGMLSMNICDYISFRSVCVSWRSVTHRIHPLIVQWLTDYIRPTISFINVADGRPYNLNLPQTRAKWVIDGFEELPETEDQWIWGSSHGLLVMLGPLPGRTTVNLLNPITRAQIMLPSLPGQLAISSRHTNIHLFSHPASCRPRQLLIGLWNHNCSELALFRHGDKKWIIYSPESGNIRRGMINNRTRFQDIAYFRDELFVINTDGRLSVAINVATLNVESVHPRPPRFSGDFRSGCFRLVRSAGDLLLVRYYEKKNVVFVFKLDRSGIEGWKWVKVAYSDDGSSSSSILQLR